MLVDVNAFIKSKEDAMNIKPNIFFSLIGDLQVDTPVFTKLLMWKKVEH